MTIFLYHLDAILDLRVKDMSEYKADARNRFPIFELVRIDLLAPKKAQKMIFFLLRNFSMAAILDSILPPYATIPRSLPGYKMLFRVHTTRNNHKI